MKNARILSLALACTFVLAAVWAFAEEPFNGKDLSGWKTRPQGNNKDYWTVGSAKIDPNSPSVLVASKEGNEMINALPKGGHGLDIYTEKVYGDIIVKLEVMVPKGSNSGIYLMGKYEVQVLDSFGHDKNPNKGDMGAIYNVQAPTNPKYVAPGEWSQFEIHFMAPRFDADGKKTANAKFVKMVLNGQTIHENVEVSRPTGGEISSKEAPQGPLMFQGNHGGVSIRNIQIEPLK